MRKILFLALILFYNSNTTYAQKRFLQPGDPLIGNWKFNTDSSGHNTKAPILGGEEIISLLPGLEVCMLAKTFDSKTGNYKTVTYFTVKKDAAKIYGEVTESEIPQWSGRVFSFAYNYHKSSDVLVITINGKKYYYSRTQ